MTNIYWLMQQDVGPASAQTNANGTANGQAPHAQPNGFSRPHNNFRNGYVNGKRATNGHANGYAHREPQQQQARQRVPSADEFPVLGGSTTPPARSPGAMGVMPNGPTAAQVLQAPPPAKKVPAKAPSVTKGSENGTERASSPSEFGSDASVQSKVNGVNGVNGATPASEAKVELKAPLSFAKVATNGVTSTPETVNTVSVSA